MLTTSGRLECCGGYSNHKSWCDIAKSQRNDTALKFEYKFRETKQKLVASKCVECGRFCKTVSDHSGWCKVAVTQVAADLGLTRGDLKLGPIPSIKYTPAFRDPNTVIIRYPDEEPSLTLGNQPGGGIKSSGINPNIIGDQSGLLSEALRNRITANRPVIHRVAVQKVKDWCLDFEISGTKGTTQNISVPTQCLFRAEWLRASDDSIVPGKGTRVKTILVGCQIQLPMLETGILSCDLEQFIKDGKFKFDACRPGVAISFGVEFLETCKFGAFMFGKAIP